MDLFSLENLKNYTFNFFLPKLGFQIRTDLSLRITALGGVHLVKFNKKISFQTSKDIILVIENEKELYVCDLRSLIKNFDIVYLFDISIF